MCCFEEPRRFIDNTGFNLMVSERFLLLIIKNRSNNGQKCNTAFDANMELRLDVQLMCCDMTGHLHLFTCNKGCQVLQKQCCEGVLGRTGISVSCHERPKHLFSITAQKQQYASARKTVRCENTRKNK